MYSFKYFLYYIAILFLFFQDTLQINEDGTTDTEQLKKNKICRAVGYFLDEYNKCQSCPGFEEYCRDCCSQSNKPYCSNNQCIEQQKESVDELQIAAQIGLTLVLIIGILILLMICRKAFHRPRSSRHGRNRRRWPWSRQNALRHNRVHHHTTTTTRGDFEFPWTFRRESTESRISERTLPPAYEDSRFIHLEKPPTYDEALQLAMAISAEPPLSLVQQESVYEESPATQRRRFGRVHESEIGSISRHIFQPRIGAPMENGEGIRSDLVISNTQETQQLDSDAWVLRRADNEIRKHLNRQRSSLSDSCEPSPETTRRLQIRINTVSENGLISDEFHHPLDNNNEGSMSSISDAPQESQHDPDSWLDVLRIPPAQVHRTSVTSRESFNINLPRHSRENPISTNNDFQEINLRASVTSSRNMNNNQTVQSGGLNFVNIRNYPYQTNTTNNTNNNRLAELETINLGFENEGFEYDA